MNRLCWWLVGRVSQTLEPDERDAVLGDLAESGVTCAQALRDVLGLVLRRQAAIWKDWRPWLALVGLVAPLGALLGLVSRRLADGSAIYIWLYLNNWTWAYLTNAVARRDLAHYSAVIFMGSLTLACWSWTSGFVLGSLTRRTVRVNGALFCLVSLSGELLGVVPYPNWNAAVFTLRFYSVIFPLMVLTALVFLPSLWGMRHGLRLGALPRLLRTILWVPAIATLIALVIWPWLGGDWQVRPLSLALAAPIGYTVATAIWRHWPAKTEPV